VFHFFDRKANCIGMSLFSKFLVAALSLANFANAWKTVSTTEWAELNDAIEGSVILPTDEDYASEYVLWAATFDHVYPSAIVECSTHDDVLKTYQFVLAHYEAEIDGDASGKFSVRCGAHSMTGASTTDGIVIDVGNLQGLEISEDGTCLVEPGVNLSQFTAWAEENDVTLPHGDCASVTFGGFLLGGGLGLTSRTFGMGGDWVAAIKMILADGSVVTAKPDNEYNDLFWATIGGGGGQFGIVTQYEMNIPEKKQVNPGLYVEMTWEYSYDTWQKVSSTWKQFMNDDELEDHFAMYLRIQPSTYLTQDYYVGLHGFWTGEQTTGLLVLAEVLTQIDLTPATAKIDYVHFEGWIESSASDRIRYSSQCKSRWAENELDSNFFDAIADSMEDLLSYEILDEIVDDDDESYGYPTQFMFISPADGAISDGVEDREKSLIAFPHRDSKYFFAMCGRWRSGYDNAQTKMQSWLKETVDTVEPFLSKYSFVSFPDWDLENWQEAYYRGNYERLTEIKAKYDPNYMFRYAQSIEPAGWSFNSQSKQQAFALESVENQHGETKYSQWEREQRNLASNNNKSNSNSKSNSFTLDIKSIELWCFIIGGIILGFAIFHLLFKKRNNKSAQYQPLKTSLHTNFETADETENVVVL